MSDLPSDPFVYDWPNVCRNCDSYTLVSKAGYCSRTCQNEDVLSGWTDERSKDEACS